MRQGESSMQGDTIAALVATHHFHHPRRLSLTVGSREFLRKAELPLLRINDPPNEYSSRILDGHQVASCTRGFVTGKTRLVREKETAIKYTHAVIMLDWKLALNCGCVMPPRRQYLQAEFSSSSLVMLLHVNTTQKHV
jgi:hypothetical protein